MSDLSERMRAEAVSLRARADRLDAMADELDGESKPTRRVSSARRQPAEGAKLKTKNRVRAYLAEHPASTAAEVGNALKLNPATVAYHMKRK